MYIHSEKDILKLVNTIIANTKGDGEKSGEDFWVKAERLFYCALIGYIWYEAPEEEKNFTTLLEMINASEAREDDEEFQSPVDLMFEKLEEKDPEHFAVKQYKKYKLAAGKTAKSILISCGARLAPFDIKELRELMETDDMELDTIGDRKTALFVIISDTDDTFNFVVSILYTQLFNLLCDKADDVYGGRLPVHVRCLLDEFANIGQIPKFEKLIATIRSREISASIILQSQSQLKAMKEEARTIFRRRNIGFIFQSFQLVSELNVEQNIMFPLLLDYRKPDPKEVDEILNLLGLTERRYHLPSQLSGGQQQRVAIGRALITKPKLILADEPTGNLDSKNSRDVMDMLIKASRQYQQTILIITHNKNLTVSVDRVFQVSDGVLTDLGGNENETLS